MHEGVAGSGDSPDRSRQGPGAHHVEHRDAAPSGSRASRASNANDHRTSWRTARHDRRPPAPRNVSPSVVRTRLSTLGDHPARGPRCAGPRSPAGSSVPDDRQLLVGPVQVARAPDDPVATKSTGTRARTVDRGNSLTEHPAEASRWPGGRTLPGPESARVGVERGVWGSLMLGAEHAVDAVRPTDGVAPRRCRLRRPPTRDAPRQRVRSDFDVERVTGIEPAFSAWEADVLPLNYTRGNGSDTGRDPRDSARCPEDPQTAVPRSSHPDRVIPRPGRRGYRRASADIFTPRTRW